jgi:hypothetical protein
MAPLNRNSGIRRLTSISLCLLTLAVSAGCKGPDLTPDPSYAGAVTAPGDSAEGTIQRVSTTTPAEDKPSDAPAPDAPQSAPRRTCCRAIHDAFTKPWYGNYLGPDNYGYDKRPIDALDAAARDHDLAYGRCKADGILGALLTIEAAPADLQLAKRAFLALPALDVQGKLMGVATGISMGFLGVMKEPLWELRHLRHPAPAVTAPSTES